ncbi:MULTISPECIES: hypothetical protein [unclassified Butyrivibrio]|uniref:hypothetical protein n=1 Tax=unclassified Butyrivibrio TaxID=2639466 RepID=UPI0008ECECE0|nr:MULTISPECIES: hypothetical protein [unclassified Butyrivibrio]RKM56052.1 hypothetical protein D6856_15050 [Butyrivibrio sp. XB500-5]SFV01760.1 hypothetical protein SAMN02910342_02986 [Butyrivibrio sp. INlla21]
MVEKMYELAGYSVFSFLIMYTVIYFVIKHMEKNGKVIKYKMLWNILFPLAWVALRVAIYVMK